MKVAIINLPGNTGKTTLDIHLLTPLLTALRLRVEDFNSGDGEPDLELAAGKFKALSTELNVAGDGENFVIDIGASNATAKIERFSVLGTSRADIDFWLIPVEPAVKQKNDSLNTASTLMEIGVDPRKIIMVLNSETDPVTTAHNFEVVFAAAKLGIRSKVWPTRESSVSSWRWASIWKKKSV